MFCKIRGKLPHFDIWDVCSDFVGTKNTWMICNHVYVYHIQLYGSTLGYQRDHKIDHVDFWCVDRYPFSPHWKKNSQDRREVGSLEVSTKHHSSHKEQHPPPFVKSLSITMILFKTPPSASWVTGLKCDRSPLLQLGPPGVIHPCVSWHDLRRLGRREMWRKAAEKLENTESQTAGQESDGKSCESKLVESVESQFNVGKLGSLTISKVDFLRPKHLPNMKKPEALTPRSFRGTWQLVPRWKAMEENL